MCKTPTRMEDWNIHNRLHNQKNHIIKIYRPGLFYTSPSPTVKRNKKQDGWCCCIERATLCWHGQTWNTVYMTIFTNTMSPSYRIAMAPFQFSYRIGLLFPLEHIFFGMIFVAERGRDAPILKVIWGVSDSYRSAPKTYTMFPSYRIAMAPFQFSYVIGHLFPLEHIFFGMIFVMERGWNASILKVIRGVSDSYRSAPKSQWKHIWNDNWVWFWV